MSPYRIEAVGFDRSDSVLNTLMLAFASDPCMRWTFRRPDVFLAAFKPFVTQMGVGMTHEGLYLAEDGAAAALWLPPGVDQDGEAIGAVIERFAADHPTPEVGAQIGAEMRTFHPHEPHWYLSMLGVDPARQGRGLGSALLKAGLARCDADGLPAYLESSNPKNVPLYERFGFEALGRIAPGDFPGLIPMLRPARAG
ncbi:ribosomal protein S18 acetylase RimI-like enzyme [Caulobacter ginsengisoli]|uniref:Ribosomal protein S18 acetylase RimI-like enzyme n=1 Tax=Caulobacter ginsengisoli TaxID=400775 RepID=A0ABU0IX42_9CAUL|nr:N-acetyltransferase [Caulobacter ginsengisoli]MDQ0466581.1 ribosomal protein S18 acetylase RimI-like enzyme [Caulobacter ginsengisoli]